jgi:hypothetical protein
MGLSSPYYGLENLHASLAEIGVTKMNIDATTPTIRRWIDEKIDEVLRRHGVSVKSPLKDTIRSRVEFDWIHSDPVLRVLTEQNRLLSLDSFVSEMRGDHEYQKEFPKGLPKISVKDQEGMTANMSRIAKGELEVTDDE